MIMDSGQRTEFETGAVRDLRAYGRDNQLYHEAVAIACAELLKAEEGE